MVDLKERPASDHAADRRVSPAAGCFGYMQPKPRPAIFAISQRATLAALFANSL
jgi:hypothetical protein